MKAEEDQAVLSRYISWLSDFSRPFVHDTVEDYILLSLRYLASNAKYKGHILWLHTQLTGKHRICKKASQISFRFSREEHRLTYRQSIQYIWILTSSPNPLTMYNFCLIKYLEAGALSDFFIFLEHRCSSEDQFWMQTNSGHCSTCQWCLSGTFREIDYRGSLRQDNEVRLAFLDNICNDFSENGNNYPPEALLSCLFQEGTADE